MAAAKWTEVAPSARQCSSRVPGPRDGGICFGAQIMSASLGGTVSPSLRPEYGWGHIESDEPAISSGPWFQYHGDEFTLPEGATRLAYNDSGLQAFSFGRSLGGSVPSRGHPAAARVLVRCGRRHEADRRGHRPRRADRRETSRLGPGFPARLGTPARLVARRPPAPMTCRSAPHRLLLWV